MSATLLSQTVLPLQTVTTEVLSDVVTIPAGAQRGDIDFPNIDPEALSDPTRDLQVTIEVSPDGAHWVLVLSLPWTGDPETQLPPHAATWIDPSFAGAQLRARLSSDSGITTDARCRIS